MLKLEKLHEDDRGEIYLLKGDLKEHQEITIHVTKKGFARGGMSHKYHDEHCVVLEGEIEYHIGWATIILRTGDTELIPRGIPHYFISLSDNIIMEWGPDPSEKNTKHLKFRKIVETINEENKCHSELNV